MRIARTHLVPLVIISSLGCQSGNSITTADAGSDAATGAGDPLDRSNLPIGDGKYGSSPKIGYLYSCQTSFSGNAGGAMTDGPWIKSDGTFDFNAKVVVQGSVAWSAHTFSATVSGTTRTVSGNGLPNHNTGTFPISTVDPAYQYDRNPNSIGQHTLNWALSATPTIATSPTCVGLGTVGVLLTGSAFFNSLDAEGRDAVAHETQDACQAHPEMNGEYHYHSVSSCLADPGTDHSALMGYARDGFGIYGVRGENGKILTDADLDECHGHTHLIEWDGQMVSLYHYHATYEYPYTVGCFKGTPISAP